ncbi:VCBS repeat-containing protein [Mycoplasma testudineum]|uniref:VCBS repeat-containing protein n=1 Tax=Mycoplasma testudineum TaxID=244584 RepID=A0A4R6IFU3_9MOLU|nr:hypothetical protein [Mycoplasma testudineum]OYD27025.1 hypothetical protein CG473_00005 [Mycoplasma testudineum]TDO21220.1 VCBS repeat-containing protein [Mycoplasma testudineum]
MTLTLSNGTANKDVKITVSPLPSKKSLDSKITPENKNQLDVNEVKTALEAISVRTTVNHKNDLPDAKNNYDDAAKFLADINQNKFDTKETTLTLSSFKNDANFGIKSFTITISKTGATSATLTVTVSGFKTTAQGAPADVNAVKAALEAVNPKTTVGHKNELPTTNNDYKTVDELLTDLNQNTFDSKQATLALGKTTNDEAAGTKTVVISISKKDATNTTATITITGFNTTAKVAQAEVETVKADLEAMEPKVTSKHTSDLPTESNNYKTVNELLTDLKKESFNKKSTTLALGEITNDSTKGTKTIIITISKSGSKDATTKITVTGFNTTAKVAQADVDAVQNSFKALVDKTTKKTAEYPSETNNYKNKEDFFNDISLTNFEEKGVAFAFVENPLSRARSKLKGFFLWN